MDDTSLSLLYSKVEKDTPFLSGCSSPLSAVCRSPGLVAYARVSGVKVRGCAGQCSPPSSVSWTPVPSTVYPLQTFPLLASAPLFFCPPSSIINNQAHTSEERQTGGCGEGLVEKMTCKKYIKEPIQFDGRHDILPRRDGCPWLKTGPPGSTGRACSAQEDTEAKREQRQELNKKKKTGGISERPHRSPSPKARRLMFVCPSNFSQMSAPLVWPDLLHGGGSRAGMDLSQD